MNFFIIAFCFFFSFSFSLAHAQDLNYVIFGETFEKMVFFDGGWKVSTRPKGGSYSNPTDIELTTNYQYKSFKEGEETVTWGEDFNSNIGKVFVVKKMSEMVSKKCGAPQSLIGRTFGRWQIGGYTSTMWVFEVSESCLAKVWIGGIYNDSVVVDGRLKDFHCNDATKGECSFSFSGDDLWASYHNPIGGRNTAVFKKTKIPVMLY